MASRVKFPSVLRRLQRPAIEPVGRNCATSGAHRDRHGRERDPASSAWRQSAGTWNPSRA